MKLTPKVAQALKECLEGGVGVLTAGEIHPDIPTIHNFCTPEIHDTVKHLGMGVFEGETPNGRFSFDAGMAMKRVDEVSYTTIGATPDVLKELGYDIGKVLMAVNGAL